MRETDKNEIFYLVLLFMLSIVIFLLGDLLIEYSSIFTDKPKSLIAIGGFIMFFVGIALHYVKSILRKLP